jgi:hypothetical protein
MLFVIVEYVSFYDEFELFDKFFIERLEVVYKDSSCFVINTCLIQLIKDRYLVTVVSFK